MRLVEISNKTRKSIKDLRNLYIKYTFDLRRSNELLEMIEKFENSNDPTLIRESLIIKNQLFKDLISILLK